MCEIQCMVSLGHLITPIHRSDESDFFAVCKKSRRVPAHVYEHQLALS